MGAIPEQQINEVKDRLDIVDIISEYVNLKKAGSNFKGLCPFHNEKTPSFIVNYEKNNFHCFGCGEGGDSIGFIMKIENLNYIETIRFLADKLGIVLEETEYSKDKIEKSQKLYEINSLVTKFYLKNLLIFDLPQQYMKKRGLKKNILNKYFLGYARNDNGLYNFLKSKGIEEKYMLELGLIGKSEERYYDKYRDRLIFPILNNKNKVIGFGARTLIDHKIKYINSPESDIFIKGKNIYGVNVINKTRNRDKVLLVEGYMDVISLYNQGIDYAVASLGTALTEEQAKLVKRYGKQVYIAYDGDEAGIKATIRAIDIFKNMDVQLLIMEFPDNMDPDEYILKYGKEEFEKLMKKAIEPVDFKLHKLSKKFDNKFEFIKEITEFLATIEGNVIRDLYIDKSAKFIGVSTESLRNDVNIKINEINNKKYYRNNKNNNNYNNSGYINNKIDNYDLNKQNKLTDTLEKELLIYSLISKSNYAKLNSVSNFIKNENRIKLYNLIAKYNNDEISIEKILDSDLFIAQNIKNKYELVKEENNKDIIEELLVRVNRVMLEMRKDEILDLINKNKVNSELMKEYTEILKKLT